MSDVIATLLGRGHSREIVVVTGRGVEIPLAHARDWTVLDLARLLGEIDRWPETRHPLGSWEGIA